MLIEQVGILSFNLNHEYFVNIVVLLFFPGVKGSADIPASIDVVHDEERQVIIINI